MVGGSACFLLEKQDLTYFSGIVKTYTFTLSDVSPPDAPVLPSERSISAVKLGGRTLKEILEHLPKPERKTAFHPEPFIIWRFEDDKTIFKTTDQWNTSRGNYIGKDVTGSSGRSKRPKNTEDEDEDDGVLIFNSLNSHLSLKEAEFEDYQIYYAPVTIALYVKELTATMAVAEALGEDITIRFTAHGQPIFFSFESGMGTYTALCALSTRTIPGGAEDGEQPEDETDGRPTPSRRSVSRPPLVAPPRKRQLESDEITPSNAKKKKNNGEPSSSRGSASSRQRGDADDDELSFANVITSTNTASRRGANEEEEPLFYPMSQVSQSLRDAGWGDVEHLSQAQLAEMLDDDMDVQGDGDTTMREAEDEDGEGTRMVGTQDFIPPTQNQQSSSFQPLFHD
ncbi:hypothetical protein CPB86DRAFT_775554 [Serendipita vermifera]|nr:hypothetical protein CPB86DRAFT_775554 [Serendipita vermifera]